MQAASPAQQLPCVVQLGFAGARRLFPDLAPGDPRLRALEAAVEQRLMATLQSLPAVLRLQPQHFLVGISQIASGADTLFSRACRTCSIPWRVFLPEHREAFLAAVGSAGTPDFTPEQRREAEALLAAEHTIQERVVSQSSDRHARFEETNDEILRVSDVIVCLLPADADGKPGGTSDMLERARQRGTPVLEIRAAAAGGNVSFTETWHPATAPSEFQVPQLPAELAEREFKPAWTRERLPSVEEYRDSLKEDSSDQARRERARFRYSAATILLTHVAATALASVALMVHPHPPDEGHHGVDAAQIVLGGLLILELLALGFGFLTHRRLHDSHGAAVWAASRLAAELGRSLKAIGNRHVYLEHFYRLPLPRRYRPLLRTLSVLHLRSTWPQRGADWKALRDEYLKARLQGDRGQIAYYERELAKDRRWGAPCHGVFLACTLMALAATGAKLALVILGWGVETIWPAILGWLAIVMPVLAVGALSWLAAIDSEARVTTFSEVLGYLKEQERHLRNARSSGEFDRLLIETETVLLGEVSNWYSRQEHRGVA